MKSRPFASITLFSIRDAVAGRLALFSARFGAWLFVGGLAAARADEANGMTFFESKIRPVLVERCIECHGAKKQKGGLRLDSREGWLRGGDSGTALVPGDPEKSLLIKVICYTDAELKMPPEDKGGQLLPQQVSDFEAWVKAGAPDPRILAEAPVKRAVADPKTFWSYQPVRAVPLPAVSRAEWVRSPVDAFILAKLDEKGLTPAPPADARTLLRRAYFDLLGLPPTPEQVEAFEKDMAPDAFARLVDTLLKSPQYGERWGRLWLDVARYADSGGYETDIYYRNAWRYRDYVVKSFNDDKPYDRFVQEQIAGDELWPDDLALDGSYQMPDAKKAHFEARLGTGLYTLGPQIHESNMDGKKIRNETLSDWVDTTGAAFMGLTVGCARCHDHKFDPISQRDYYALQAAFAGSKEVEVPIINAMGVADFKQHYPRVLAVVEARQGFRLFEGRTAGRELTMAEKTERQQLLERIAGEVLALPAQTALGEPFDGIFEIATASVLGHERPELVPAIHLLKRGELSLPGELVPAALPGKLRESSGWRESMPGPFGGRKQLALWLTSPAHPLTARVMVNRVWHGHFGRGLVSTLNDFGQMGERPSHPELLDWLASEFIRQGWSVKEMHRVIMLSSAYQMASTWQNERNTQGDPSNHFLWKMNRRRLEAETLWDAIHAVAGTLNMKMGGRPVVPPLGADEGAPANWIVSADPAEHTRRGLYILQRRNFRFPMFDVFDLPVNAVSAPARDVSIVAPQALWLLNNGTASRQAAAFAARLRADATSGWNAPGFGSGQSGWEGAKATIYAGWAKRINNGNDTPSYDDPEGSIITHGATSVLWKAPSGIAGSIEIRGGLWNIRHLGRSGAWKLWKNDTTLLAEGFVDDTSGTSAKHMDVAAPAAVPCQPGDTFRLEILEGDFVGVRLVITSAQGPRDLAADFSLTANPTATGWQYSESIANGGGPLLRSISENLRDEPAAWVERAWRLALGRAPSTAERDESLTLLNTLSPEKPDAALAQLCLALLNLQEFCYAD